MSRRRVLIAAAALALVLMAAAIWFLQSDWLREDIRARIVQQAEKATGGRVELGAFHYDWRTRTVEVDRLVIHGTEGAGSAPLLSIARVVAVLHFFDFGIVRIDAERPVAHIVVDAAGHTNLPRPRMAPSNKTVPERILNLKIAHFDLRNGAFLVDAEGRAPRSIPWSARGDNLIAALDFDPAALRYAGDVSLAGLHAGKLDMQLSAHALMERNRVVVPSARVATNESTLDFKDVIVNDFTAPVTTGHYAGRVSLAEVTHWFPIKFRNAGTVQVDGDGRFVSRADYRATGSFNGAGLAIERFRNVRAAGSFDAVPGRVDVPSLRAWALGGEVVAKGAIHDFARYEATGRIAHFDLRQTAGLYSKQPLAYDAMVSGPFGTHGRFDGQIPDATLHAALDGQVRGDVAFHYDAAAKKIDLGQSWMELPKTRVDVSGTLGERLDVKASSRDAGDLLPLIGHSIDLLYSEAAFEGTVSGALNAPRIAGHVSGSGIRYKGETIDSARGDVTLSSASLGVANGAVVYQDLHAAGGGTLALRDWIASPASAISGNLQLTNGDLTKIMALAGHKEVEVSGLLNGTARISGTLGEPLATGDLTATSGLIYRQPYDSISGSAQWLNRNTQALTAVFVSGAKRVNITSRFEHAGTQFPAGRLEFNLTSNTMALNQIALVRQRQPDIVGFGKFHADGAIRIGHDAKHEIEVNLLNLNADASANGVELAGRNLGDARFTARTEGSAMTAHFDSNAAKAAIHGEGTMQLAGDYPVDAKVTFSNAGLNALAALAVTADEAKTLNFDGSAEGQVSVRGPARAPGLLTAAIELAQIQLHALPGSAVAQNLPGFALRNRGPVRMSLAKSILKVENARFEAPETDVSIDGSIDLADAQRNPLNLRAQGKVNLALARTFNPDLAATGSLNLDARVRGDWRTPDVSGSAAIRNADFHYLDFTNGLTKASGNILFSGTRATIQSFSGESGGGRVDVGGFAALSNGLVTFRLEARTHEVRVRYPEGVSSVSDSALTLAGTSQRSQVSGAITIHRIAINPKSDAATILALSAEPIRTPAARNSLLSNMNLDVQIETAPDVALQTSVTESIQADANLRLRGTAANPAVLGRINITQGELVFFGNKYSINQGSVSFLNPAKIDPILNVDLETRARGVDVILTVSGPVNKLNLSYRSDPPLQFSDILALLATGRAPTDPTIAVRDTGQAPALQQLGASALIGQAIANPVAGRLQRFFGVSRLKIDPQLTGITGSPEARLTIEQQVTPDILFTYITDVSSTSTQLIRVQWSFNRHWSAILIREENGYVGLDFAYKKGFK